MCCAGVESPKPAVRLGGESSVAVFTLPTYFQYCDALTLEDKMILDSSAQSEIAYHGILLWHFSATP